ncbi:hypothetical protein NBT05_14480 [Aquimarina sp. ERC-38]|uniref:tetratricopeptide repeat protein n=1 Tax=Aquimarina sp. ERC-38 TaxID=2949996 RepID=UPI002245753E|nr:hypothetical protein [Aquimarina sp. ERC-38]UZO80149.1 hypothetical protein NBT05_14480 [Aquimarina sp. ERC-38]
MSNLLDKYIFQALDAYPYNLEEAVESLSYALSYNQNNVIALGLMGQIYAEQLKNFEVAKEYYQQALAQDLHALDIYSKYINVLIWNEDYGEAKKLINFAITIKGIDKAMIYLKKAILYEYKAKYKKALKIIKLAKKNTYNNQFLEEIKEEETRIKNKIAEKNKLKHKGSKASSKKSKKK